jgi:hypothetical protein
MNEYTPTPAPQAGESFTIDLTPSYDDLKNQIAFLGAGIESWKKQWDKARDYLQASIDREEWSNDELAEPFWEELALMFDLDLKRTKEVEISITLTYSGTVTVPYDCDVETDLDVEGVANNIEVLYGGNEIEEQWITFDDQVIEAV